MKLKDIKLRPQQKECLAALGGTKFNIGIAATGVGKSIIAMKLAERHGGAHIITPNRALQKQYANDFSFAANLEGKKHYYCKHYGTTADKCYDLLAAELEALGDNGIAQAFLRNDHDAGCTYAKARQRFNESKFGISGVEIASFGITNNSKVLIIDEAHNIIDKMLNQSGFTIGPSNKLYGFEFGELNMRRNLDVIIDEALTIVESTGDRWENGPQSKQDQYESLLKRLSDCKKYISWFATESNEDGGIDVKPISLRTPFNNLTDGFDKIYLLSATIPDTDIFCKILGIEDVTIWQADSPFSEDNVKVIGSSSISLTRKNYDESIDKAVKMLSWSLAQEPGRGIVHVSSFKQLEDIRERLPAEHHSRITWHEREANKDQLMEDHYSKEGSVLISPSLYEGIDLKGDRGEFVIVFKYPFPFLTNWTRAMDRRYEGFYAAEALNRFIQGMGRCLRGPNDKCNIYLVDSNCKRFITGLNVPSNIRKAKMRWFK